MLYISSFHRGLHGAKGKLLAIGKRGFALVRFNNGQITTSVWRDVKPVGEVTAWRRKTSIGLRAYPKTQIDRSVINAQAKCSIAT